VTAGTHRFTAERFGRVEDAAKENIKANEMCGGGCGQFIDK